MIGRGVTVGLTLLCALILSAFMASSAMAVKGTTAFTCVPEPNPTKTTKGFEDAHCTKPLEGTKVKFIHVEVKQDETTIFHGTNEKTSTDTTKSTPAILKIGGLIPSRVSCNKVFAHGGLVNRLDAATKEHYIEGEEGIEIHYTECEVSEPAACVIPGKAITVEKVKATTKGQGDNVKFEPVGSKTFVSITFEKCSNPFANGKHEVTGSVKAQVSGATLTFTHETITKEGTLEFFGANAGLEGKITLNKAAGTLATDKTENPLSATTVET